MAATRILAGLFCFAAIGSSGGIGGRIVKEHQINGYEKVIKCARKEIGVREENFENCGTRVRNYLNCVGIQKAEPWCAAWVSFVFYQAGYRQPRTGWSPALFPAKRLVPKPLAGLVFGIYYAAKKRIAHCGIVERLQGDLLITLEGNTNLAGSREGDGVYRKIRHKRTVRCYADWIKAI